MTSKREAVLNAVTARIVAALPGAEVKRNLAKAERIGPGGLVVVRDGDPGEPEVMLSPLIYLYSHRVPVEIAAYESATLPREAVIDQMLGAIGAMLAGDRTLGGLCDWIEAEAPVADDVETLGALPGRVAEFAILAVYATPDPLG
jgi:hypothetical protein